MHRTKSFNAAARLRSLLAAAVAAGAAAGRAAMADREPHRKPIRADLEADDRRIRSRESGHQGRAGARRPQGPLDQVRRRRTGEESAVHRDRRPDHCRIQRLPAAARQVLERGARGIAQGVERGHAQIRATGRASSTGCRSGAAPTRKSTTATSCKKPGSIRPSHRRISTNICCGRRSSPAASTGRPRCSAARPTRPRAFC